MDEKKIRKTVAQRQESLTTEGEGSVQLTSLYFELRSAPFYIELALYKQATLTVLSLPLQLVFTASGKINK
jgi:hypothetical protein